MKDNSFAMAMEKIVGQAEAEQQQEIRAQRRSQIFGRVRGIFAALLLATVIVFGYCYRVQLQDKFLPKHVAKQAASEITTDTGAPAGKTAAGIKAAQDNAATRDKVVNEIEKGK